MVDDEGSKHTIVAEDGNDKRQFGLFFFFGRKPRNDKWGLSSI